MSEQPPRASGHLPLPVESAPHRFEPDPEAPPMESARHATPVEAWPGRTAGAGLPLTDAEERVRETAGEGLDRAADAARRLGHRAREQGGLAVHAEPLAYRVGDSLQSAASYVRDHDVRSMRDDVEVGVRAAPLKSLAMAALGGFLIGRLFR